MVTHVKAVYGAGAWESKGPDDGWTMSLSSAIYNFANSLYAIFIKYMRINKAGYGVARVRKPIIAMDKFIGSVGLKEGVQGNDTRTLCNLNIDRICVGLHSNDNIINGSAVSQQETIYMKTDDYTGEADAALINYLIDAVQNDPSKLNYLPMRSMGLRGLNARQQRVQITIAANFTAASKSFVGLTVKTALENGITPTYYQLQWALLNNGEYKEPDDAKLSCYQAGYSWLRYDYVEERLPES